jgi:phosphoserine phosphatase RsbU/P
MVSSERRPEPEAERRDRAAGPVAAAPDQSDPRERLHQVQSVTDTALARLGNEQLLAELLDRVREQLVADTVTVLLLDHSATQLVVFAALGLERELSQGVRLRVGEGFDGRIAATCRPLIVDHVDATTVANPLLWERGLHALLGVPLLASGKLIGVLHVGSTVPRQFTEHEVQLLQIAGDRLALVIDAQNLAAERAAAEALQRSLLPAVPPSIAGLEFAARYVPGADHGVGGDWYDVFPLPGDRVGVVIGDVVGHGLAAAVVMGRLRSALRAYALDVDDPGVVLEKLHRKVTHFEGGAMATVSYAVIDPGRDQARLALAGHLPPILALSGEQAAQPDLPAGPPVGFPDVRRSYRRSYPGSVLKLPAGAVLCLFTDGLVERRNATIDEGLARLRVAVTAASPEFVCAQIMASLVGRDPVADDVALLAVRRTDLTRG